jgi:hypothetical protein
MRRARERDVYVARVRGVYRVNPRHVAFYKRLVRFESLRQQPSPADSGILPSWSARRDLRRRHVTGGQDMGKIFIVVPEAPMEETAQLKPERKLGRGGIRLGVLDNSKANADYLLELIVDGVKKELDVTSVLVTRKPASSRPASYEVLDKLAKETDLVVSAMAD